MKRLLGRRVLVGGSVGAAVIAAIVLGLGLWRQPLNGSPEFKGGLGPFVAHPAPVAMPALAFTDIEGKALNIADFKGKVVLLNLWATWCGPCVEEMPSLDRLQAQLGTQDFSVAALSIDREGLSLVKPFIEKLGIRNLLIYLDTSHAAMRALKIRGLPTTLLIDRDGREIGRLEGAASWDSPAAEAFIRFYRDGRPKQS